MRRKPHEIIEAHAAEGARVRTAFFEARADMIVDIAKAAAVSMANGGKVLFCGNGGSAADAQHLAAEFVNRFMMERPALPGLALTTDTSILTAVSNDYDFSQVFQKQVQAFGRPGDMLVGFSTSGESRNVLLALQEAKARGMITVGFLGRTGGTMFPHCDYALMVDSRETPVVQEVHIAAGHCFCRLVDYFLFEAVTEIQPYLVAAGDRSA